MNDFEELAERMFGGTTSSPAPSNARDTAQPTAEDDMAERLFGSPKPDKYVAARNSMPHKPLSEMSEAEQAHRLYGDTDPALYHGDAMRNIESASMEKFIQSPEDAKEVAAYWGDTFEAFGLSSTESAAVADIGVSVFSNPPTEELVASWVEQAQTALVQDFGPTGAAQALADAQAYVDRYASPELKDVLMSTGLGNHPQLVRMAAAKGRALRVAGKLR